MELVEEFGINTPEDVANEYILWVMSSVLYNRDQRSSPTREAGLARGLEFPDIQRQLRH